MEARRPGRSGRSSTGHHLAPDPRRGRARTGALAARRQHGTRVRHGHDRARRRRGALPRRVRRTAARLGHDAARRVRARASGVRAFARSVRNGRDTPTSTTADGSVVAPRPPGAPDLRQVRRGGGGRGAAWSSPCSALLGIAAATAIGPKLGVRGAAAARLVGIVVSFLPFVPDVRDRSRVDHRRRAAAAALLGVGLDAVHGVPPRVRRDQRAVGRARGRELGRCSGCSSRGSCRASASRRASPSARS